MRFDDSYEPEEEDEGEDRDDEDLEASEVERLCREALARLDEDDLEGARELAIEGVGIDDEHPFPLFVLGLIAEQEGDSAGARYFADRALQYAATNPEAITFRAQLHVSDFEFMQAERLLRFGIVHNPDDAQLHEVLARVFLAEGKTAEALQAARASLRIDPSNHGAYAVRAAALEESGDAEGVLAVLRQAVQMHPDDPYSMVELAAVEAEHGNVQRARVLLARAQRLAPRDVQVHDIRVMIEGAHDHPLLLPLPAMLRWVRDFPGGLVGFLLAFLIASMPLYELANGSPEYAVPVWGLMTLWALAATYMWVGPAVMHVRLNRIAGLSAAERMREEFSEHVRAIGGSAPVLPTAVPAGMSPLDVTAAGHGSSPVHAERLIDTVALLFQGKRYRSGVALLRDAADVADEPLASEADRLARRLSTLRSTVFFRVATIPGDTRILVSAAVALATGAPAFASMVHVSQWRFHVASFALALLAWSLVRGEHRRLAMLDEALGRMRALAAEARRGRGSGGDLRAAG